MKHFLPLRPGDHVGFTACSNALPVTAVPQIENLCAMFREMGLIPVLSPCIYGKNSSPCSASDREKAAALDAFYRDDSIRAIFDLSGGDLANGVLSWLNLETVRCNPKPFFGYSDLSAILNAIYTATEIPGGLYSIRNLLGADGPDQRRRFQDYIFGRSAELTRLNCRFVQGSAIEGVVVGGNLRCFLKLAGTPFFPNLRGKVLLLESLGGGLPQISTLLHQLRQMGAFHQVSGVLLGTFTRYQETEALPIEELVCSVAGEPFLSVAKTEDVGHGANARCVEIGVWQSFGP